MSTHTGASADGHGGTGGRRGGPWGRGGRARAITIAVVAVILVVLIGFVVWTQIVMQGTRSAALAVWEDPAVTVTDVGDAVLLQPTDRAPGFRTGAAAHDGLVFIPGAKVDPYAYLGVLSGVVAQEGLTVVITKPTLNLAFFDQRPLSTFTAAAPDVEDWYVGGHSLGGVRACQLAGDADQSPAVRGLVLFGSYCANDLSGSDLSVLSIAGTEDGLSTPDKIAGARHLLPADATMVSIAGANHASFGDYGLQPGDGTATIDHTEAHTEITRALADFFG